MGYQTDAQALADKRIMLEAEAKRKAEMPVKPEAVDHPSHYGGDTTYETIKVIAAWGLGFLLGNCVKCISRAGKKDTAKLLEDLRKGRWYLDKAIERLERNEALF
jgi:hypothetical protein